MRRKSRKRSAKSTTQERNIVLKALADCTERLRSLCDFRAAMAARRTRKKELKQLRELIAQNRLELKRLAIKAEACEGAYQAAVEALRTVALADLRPPGDKPYQSS